EAGEGRPAGGELISLMGREVEEGGFTGRETGRQAEKDDERDDVPHHGGDSLARAGPTQNPSGSLKSARKICDVLSGPRLEVHISHWPSGEKTGRPSKPSWKVSRAVRPVSIFIR